MQIELAKHGQLTEILNIYERARAFMRQSGNPTQWAGGYPSHTLVETDIQEGYLYVCMEGESILGVFYYRQGEDPTYQKIDGAWQNDKPYGVIHRIAVGTPGRGVAAFCFAWCFARCNNLKIDTHEDNLPMQRALAKNGFVRCGIIHLANGDPRIAYQKCE